MVRMVEIKDEVEKHNIMYGQRSRERESYKRGIKPALLESNSKLERELEGYREILIKEQTVKRKGKKVKKPAMILYTKEELTTQERGYLGTDKIGIILGYPPMAVQSLEERKDLKEERGYTLEYAGIQFWVGDKNTAEKSLEWCKREYNLPETQEKVVLKDIREGKYYKII